MQELKEKVQDNEKSLREILMGSTPILEKPLTSIKRCQRCEERIADSLNEMLCSICFRKLRFDELPDEQKILMYSKIVPEKYILADLSDLHSKLKEKLCSETKSGVLLWGTTGLGKTYAMCALTKSLIAEGFKCERTSYELLCLHLRDTFKPTSKQSEWDIIKPLIDCDALFLEDIGTTKSIDSKESDFSLRTLLVILDVRIEHCRPTYITTNKSVENIARSFDERIGDRLRLLTVIKMEGKSKR